MEISKTRDMDLFKILVMVGSYSLPEIAKELNYNFGNMYYLLTKEGFSVAAIKHDKNVIAARKFLCAAAGGFYTQSIAGQYMGVCQQTAGQFIKIVKGKMEAGKMKYLVAGFESERRVDLLLNFTKLGSESVIEGLKHHLVDGYSIKVAAALSSSDAGSINRMLAALEKVAEKHDDLLEYDRGRPSILSEFMEIHFKGQPLDLVAYTKEVDIDNMDGEKSGKITIVHFKNGHQRCFNSSLIEYVIKEKKS
jgi:hypothetical protein